MRSIPFLLAATCVLVAAPVAAEPPMITESWEETFALSGPISRKGLVGDFDGDGRKEVAMVSDWSNDSSSATRSAITLIGYDAVGDWSIQDVFVIEDGKITNDIHLLKRPGGDALVARIERVEGINLYFDTLIASGNPLMVETRFSGSARALRGVADLDGDGTAERIEESYLPVSPYTQFQSRELTNDTVNWSVPVGNGIELVVGQLDNDPALEVVIGNTPGEIRDGATGAVDWFYANGLPLPLIGNVDSEANYDEFITRSGSTTTLFGSMPYAPLYDFSAPCCANGSALVDLDQNGVDEYVIQKYDGAAIIDIATGLRRDITFPGLNSYSKTAIASVDSDADPEFVVAYRAPGIFHGLRIYGSEDGQLEAVTNGVPEGPMAVTIGDLDGDGSDEIVSLLEAGSELPTLLQVRDAQNGALLREIQLPQAYRYWQANASSNIALGQLDADSALEIVFALYETDDERLMAIDGLTLQTQWSIIPRNAALDSVPLLDVRIADTDLDGMNEVVAISRETHAYLFHGVDGTMTWRSIVLEFQSFASVEVLQTDTDAVPEILVWTGRNLFAFDGKSRMLDWSMTLFDGAGRMFAIASGNTCRLGLYGMDGLVRTATCTGRDFQPLLELQSTPTRLLPLCAGGNYLAVLDGNLTHVDVTTDEQTILMRSIGWFNSQHLSGIANTQESCSGSRIAVAHNGKISSLLLTIDTIFDAGFE